MLVLGTYRPTTKMADGVFYDLLIGVSEKHTGLCEIFIHTRVTVVGIHGVSMDRVSDTSEAKQKKKKKFPLTKKCCDKRYGGPTPPQYYRVMPPLQHRHGQRTSFSSLIYLLNVHISSAKMAIIPRSLRGLLLVFTALTILLPPSNAVEPQEPLQAAIDVPKRVAIIGRRPKSFLQKSYSVD